MTLQQFKPPHPGEFIKTVYLDELGLSANALAKALGVHSSTALRLVSEKSDISSDMAIRLEKVLGRSAESWMQMQDNFDLYKARSRVNIAALKPIKVLAAG